MRAFRRLVRVDPRAKMILAGELATRLDVPRSTALGMVVLAVLLLRLSWTATEVVTAGSLYWWPITGRAPQVATRSLNSEVAPATLTPDS